MSNLTNTTGKNRMNVLVTAVGAPGAPNIIGLIRKREDIRIVGLDMNENVGGRHLVDTFRKNIRGDAPDFARYLLQIAQEENVQVILPLSTDELFNLSREKKLFEDHGIAVCISNHETIKIANNKYRLYEHLKNTHFIPGYRLPRSVDDLNEMVHELGYPEKPVCVKPHISHGSRGFRIITNDISKYGYDISTRPYNPYIRLKTLLSSIEAVAAVEGRFPKIYAVEYLPGEEWGIDIFVDPVSRQKYIATRNNGEVTQSAVAKGALILNKKLIEIGEQITDLLEFAYGLNIDIRYSDTGEPKVIEVNPRLPATIKLVSESGWNFPLMSILRAFDPSCPMPRVDGLVYGKSIFFYKESLVV